MERSDFNEKMLRLCKFYHKGEEYAELSDYESEIWFETIKSWSKEHFDDVITECFKTLKYMPKLADLLNCERNVQQPMKYQTKQRIEYQCDRCKNTGLIKYFRNENGIDYDYFARCNCKNAEEHKNLFPTAEEIGVKVFVASGKENSNNIYRKVEYMGHSYTELVRQVS